MGGRQQVVQLRDYVHAEDAVEQEMQHLRGLYLLLVNVIELVDDAAHQQLRQLPPQLGLIFHYQFLPVPDVELYFALHLLLLQELQAQLGQSRCDLLVLLVHLSEEVLPGQTAHKGPFVADVHSTVAAVAGLGSSQIGSKDFPFCFEAFIEIVGGLSPVEVIEVVLALNCAHCDIPERVDHHQELVQVLICLAEGGCRIGKWDSLLFGMSFRFTLGELDDFKI